MSNFIYKNIIVVKKSLLKRKNCKFLFEVPIQYGLKPMNLTLNAKDDNFVQTTYNNCDI